MLGYKRKIQHINNDQNTFTYQFHPLIEPAVIFLTFRDCGSLSTINQRMHNQLWKCVLRSSKRDHDHDPSSWKIKVSIKTKPWLSRYAKFLNHQHLAIDNSVNSMLIFKELNIPQLQCLTLTHLILTPPLILPKLKYLRLLYCAVCTQMKFDNIKSITIFDYDHFKIHSIIQILPTTVKDLKLIGYSLTEITTWQVFHHIKSLTLSRVGAKHLMFEIQDKFPCLKSLTIHGTFLEDLSSLRQLCLRKLVIRSQRLTNLAPLREWTIEELDVSNCENITDFSFVKNIPIVKKYQKNTL